MYFFIVTNVCICQYVLTKNRMPMAWISVQRIQWSWPTVTSGIKKDIKVKGKNLKLSTLLCDLAQQSELKDQNQKIWPEFPSQQHCWQNWKPYDKTNIKASPWHQKWNSCAHLLSQSCESWSVTAKLQRSIKDLEMRYYHKILNIS